MPTDHATGETVYHQGIVTDSDATEAIYGMEWESLDTTTGTDGVGPDLTNAVASWRAGAHGVILDHRTGFGGTILAPEILWNFSVPRHDDDVYVERAFGDEPQPSLTGTGSRSSGRPRPRARSRSAARRARTSPCPSPC